MLYFAFRQLLKWRAWGSKDKERSQEHCILLVKLNIWRMHSYIVVGQAKRDGDAYIQQRMKRCIFQKLYPHYYLTKCHFACVTKNNLNPSMFASVLLNLDFQLELGIVWTFYYYVQLSGKIIHCGFNGAFEPQTRSSTFSFWNILLVEKKAFYSTSLYEKGSFKGCGWHYDIVPNENKHWHLCGFATKALVSNIC